MNQQFFQHQKNLIGQFVRKYNMRNNNKNRFFFSLPTNPFDGSEQTHNRTTEPDETATILSPVSPYLLFKVI